jgi:hypothetical protein
MAAAKRSYVKCGESQRIGVAKMKKASQRQRDGETVA